MGLIDTHCHLDMLEDLDGSLEHAKEQGLTDVITIGVQWSKRPQQLDLIKKDDPSLRVWASIGTHPGHVGHEELPSLEDMVKELKTPHVVAIGETGLDYLPDNLPLKEKQKTSFRRHIEAARVTGLPVVIHTREADEDTIAILREETEKGAFPFLIHCFTASKELADAALELGGYISFSGILTFPKCEHLRDIARTIPRDRILVETDSPYLAPVPFRGKKNKPGNVASTAQCLADTLGVDISEVESFTTANAKRLFKLTEAH